MSWGAGIDRTSLWWDDDANHRLRLPDRTTSPVTDFPLYLACLCLSPPDYIARAYDLARPNQQAAFVCAVSR